MDGVRPSLRVPALAAVLAAAACAPPGADRVERLRIEDPSSHWANEGFVRLEPATHLPSSDATQDQVQVWLRLPDDGVIATVAGPDGPVLRLPPGSEIDRVELAGEGQTRRVVDVRGARIDADGRTIHRVLRRESGRLDAALFGFAWPAADAEAHEAATDLLLEGLAATAELRAMDHGAVQRTLAAIRGMNQCNGCHAPLQPAATRDGERLVRRGTDASGFYVPQAIFADELPLETYGAFDRSLDDPFVSVHCPDGTPELVEDDRAHIECPGGAAPSGRLSLSAALAAQDPRAQALCRARAHLFAHLDPAGQRAFADAAAACEPAASAGRTELSRRDPTNEPT